MKKGGPKRVGLGQYSNVIIHFCLLWRKTNNGKSPYVLTEARTPWEGMTETRMGLGFRV